MEMMVAIVFRHITMKIDAQNVMDRMMIWTKNVIFVKKIYLFATAV